MVVVVVVVVVVIVVVALVVVAVWRRSCRAIFRGLSGMLLVSCDVSGHFWASLWGSLGYRVSLLGSFFSWVGLGWPLGVPGGFSGILGWRAEAEGGLGKNDQWQWYLA